MFEEIGCSRKVSGEFEFELFSYSSGALVRSPFILFSPLMTSSCNVAELAVSLDPQIGSNECDSLPPLVLVSKSDGRSVSVLESLICLTVFDASVDKSPRTDSVLGSAPTSEDEEVLSLITESDFRNFDSTFLTAPEGGLLLGDSGELPEPVGYEFLRKLGGETARLIVTVDVLFADKGGLGIGE